MNKSINADNIEKWGIFELTLKGPEAGNPFVDVTLSAEFKYKNRVIEPEGFYDGDGVYKVRFSPDLEGTWKYVTKSNCSQMDGIAGEFECVSPAGNNHGPVKVKNTFHFAYADGTPYYPVGTTCYAWVHQGDELEEQTLETLKTAPFNKMRMCAFPKYYDYNKTEPAMFPYERKDDEGFDYTRFNPEFFKHLEKRIYDLLDLGIETDLILFHPYDRWGFSDMKEDGDDLYLHYIIARLASCRSIWWSLANEYDIMGTKKPEDWERYARIILENDPYGRLRSIHNCIKFYDHTKPWVTHASIQRVDLYKTSENTDEWRRLYNKPVVIDECAYEGNINHGWGNIPGHEMTRRFWEGMVRGGYVGHGETYMHPEDILWWSKGGKLYGTSPERIAFMRRILEEGPEEGITPTYFDWDCACGGVPGKYYLVYFGFMQPAFRHINIPAEGKFTVDIIDTWDMTITPVEGVYEKHVRVDMPGKQYMALRLRKVEE